MESRSRRRAFLRTAGATGAVALAGCIAGNGGISGTVVQLAADSGAKGIRSDINSALHAAGLPADVDVEILAGSPDTAQQQFSQWLSAGLERPSLLRMDSGWTVPFILREQLADLSEGIPDVARDVKENYFAASVSTAQDGKGDIYGLPLFSDFGMMLYRKDLVKQAGFKPDGEEWASSPLTWKKFSQVTKETMEQGGTTYGFTFQARVYELGPIVWGILGFQGQYADLYNQMAAASIIGALPVAILVVVAQEKIVSGLTAGALTE